MTKNTDKNVEYASEINISHALSVIVEDKKRFFIIVSFFVLTSIILALIAPSVYKATAVLAPAQDDSSALSKSLGAISGLSSFVGVRITGESNESKIAQEVMKSRSFIEKFIFDNDLEVKVYAAMGWDRSSNQLKIDNSIYDVQNKEWLIKDKATGRQKAPTGFQLYKKFSRNLTVNGDPLTGLVTVSILSYSPSVAKQWVDLFVSAINKDMQHRKVTNSDRNIEYLRNEIQKTSISDMKETLYAIMEDQIKTKLLAQASPEYAFITVNPSMIPEKRSSPNRRLMVIVGLLLGIIVAASVSFFYRKN